MARVVYGRSIYAMRVARARCRGIEDPQRREVCVSREYARLFRW